MIPESPEENDGAPKGVRIVEDKAPKGTQTCTENTLESPEQLVEIAVVATSADTTAMIRGLGEEDIAVDVGRELSSVFADGSTELAHEKR